MDDDVDDQAEQIGRERERVAERVRRARGAPHQRGHLLRVGPPVPRPQCTEVHLRGRVRDPRSSLLAVLQRKFFTPGPKAFYFQKKIGNYYGGVFV